MTKLNDDDDHHEDGNLASEELTFRIPLNWYRDPTTVSGEERIGRLVHNFEMQTYFGTRGTLRQCLIVQDARQLLTDDEMKRFCEGIGVPENSPTFEFLLGTGKRFLKLQKANYWSIDWLALYFLTPPYDEEDFARLLRMGRLLEGKSAERIRDALVFALNKNPTD